MPTPPQRTRRAAKPAAVRSVPDAEPVETDVEEGLPEPVEFVVTFLRDGEDEEHTFRARPKITYKRMRESARAKAKGGADALLLFERLIRPSLCDDDGTPVKWEPQRNGKTFVDPDGNERDLKELPALLEFDNGSSRRRWDYLMDTDEDADVQFDEVIKAYETLVEAGNEERPTQKSRS